MLAGHPARFPPVDTGRAPPFATLRAMRGALLALLVTAAGAVLVQASVADSPARARAQASLVTGSNGDFGTLTARGDAERADGDVTVEDTGVVVGAGQTVARASRRGGHGSARAAALGREIDLFDGYVTAKLARRTATATAAGVVYAGRVVGLTVAGRKLGDVASERTYRLPDGGTVVVNRATTALRVTLGAARGEDPAGAAGGGAGAPPSAPDPGGAPPPPATAPPPAPAPRPPPPA